MLGKPHTSERITHPVAKDCRQYVLVHESITMVVVTLFKMTIMVKCFQNGGWGGNGNNIAGVYEGSHGDQGGSSHNGSSDGSKGSGNPTVAVKWPHRGKENKNSHKDQG